MLPGFDAMPLKREFKRLMLRVVSASVGDLLNSQTASGARGAIGAAASGSAASSGLTMATSRLLGRTTASTGAIEEITVGTGLSLSGGSLACTVTAPSIRQCILEGPVTSAGLPNFGLTGVGTTSVSITGTLKVAAAYGELDRIGTIVDPVWTGLSSPGARYFLYLDPNSDGTATAGSSLNLQPNYQWGGTYSVTNGQFTFNKQEMTGKVGNGATAAQAYRVYVGECLVSGGGVVSDIYWYQLKRRYEATSGSVPSTTRITMAHTLGFTPDEWSVKLVCVTTDAGYGVGEEVPIHQIMDSGTNPIVNSSSADRFDMGVVANSNTLYLYHKTTGALTALTNGNWDTKFYAKGSW